MIKLVGFVDSIREKYQRKQERKKEEQIINMNIYVKH